MTARSHTRTARALKAHRRRELGRWLAKQGSRPPKVREREVAKTRHCEAAPLPELLVVRGSHADNQQWWACGDVPRTSTTAKFRELRAARKTRLFRRLSSCYGGIADGSAGRPTDAALRSPGGVREAANPALVGA